MAVDTHDSAALAHYEQLIAQRYPPHLAAALAAARYQVELSREPRRFRLEDAIDISDIEPSTDQEREKQERQIDMAFSRLGVVVKRTSRPAKTKETELPPKPAARPSTKRRTR